MESETNIYTVDSFAHGVAFGKQDLSKISEKKYELSLLLGLDGVDTALAPRSRYLFQRRTPHKSLEERLQRLAKAGTLSRSVFFLGVSTDPFLPFDDRFDASMRFLELFQRYIPGMLHVQTRSPLIVLAMPVLKSLGARASVTIGIETPLEDTVRRYSPELPAVEERLKAVGALRCLGVQTSIQVSPVLPYGDWRADAQSFARLLVQSADYIKVKPLLRGWNHTDERRLRSSAVWQKLSNDRKYHYLRPDSAVPLMEAMLELSPNSLNVPSRPQLENKQLSFFAA